MNEETKSFIKEFYNKIRQENDERTAELAQVYVRTVTRWKYGECAPSLETMLKLFKKTGY